jgi:TonB-dependent SusC/RagA subfamily outer membrane receptor
MKLTTILLLTVFVFVNTNGYSQKVTIDKINVSLEEVLISIHQQTGYSYSVKTQILQNAKRFDIHVKDTDLEYALTIALKNQSLSYIISEKVIIIKNNTKIDLQGWVVTEKGEPTVAIVQVKGTSIALTTNSEGYFVLKTIDENAVLIVSGIYINPLEVKVSGRTDLSNIMVYTKPKILDDETVIAFSDYQQHQPNDAIHSFEKIDSKKLNEQTDINILQRLNVIPKIQLFNNSHPGTNDRVILLPTQGQNTRNGFTGPLIILDKFPFEGDIGSINPLDVESITILKDAAAISIYGAEGANGAIVITTKRGKSNKKKKKPKTTN